MVKAVKYKICSATKLQQLQQHLFTDAYDDTLCPGRCQELAGSWGLEAWTPPSMPHENSILQDWEQSAVDKPRSCRSRSRSSRTAENVSGRVWHYRLAEIPVKKKDSVISSGHGYRPSPLLPALGSGEGPCSYIYQQCTVPFLPEKIMLISNYCMQCQSINIFSLFRSYCASFKGGSGRLSLQWEERDKRA